MMMTAGHRTRAGRLLLRCLLTLFMVAFLALIAFPFFWLVLGSFKTMRELFAVPLSFWPQQWLFGNYAEAFNAQPFGLYLYNSLFIGIVSTVTVLFTASLAAYSLARVNIRFKKLVLILVLTVSLLPPITLLNPIYQMMSNVGLLNTHIGLALVLSAVEMPTAIWLLASFFQAIPCELEESAMLDGASVLRCFVQVVMPLVTPGVVTVSILTFVNAWNNYIFAVVLNQKQSARTVAIALTMFETETYTPWHVISAAAVIVSLPLIVGVLLMQKHIIGGMLEGGVKG